MKDSEPSDTILALEDLTLRFGGVEVVSHVNLKIDKNNLWGIIGPNGSGKTCVLNCINNFYHPQEGKIYFMNKEIKNSILEILPNVGHRIRLEAPEILVEKIVNFIKL